MKHLVCLCLLLIAPAAMAQSYDVGQGDAYIGLPHSMRFNIGANDLEVVVAAIAVCEDGFDAPAPLRIQVPANAPDDGDGPAWTFAENETMVDWTLGDDGNYTIEETIRLSVTGQGYGDTGRSVEFALQTVPVEDASCSSAGFTMPARSGHTHASIPARPAAANDVPGPGIALVGLSLAAAATGRRK